MLASQTIELHEDRISDLPQATVNAAARIAVEYADFCRSVIRDNKHAQAHGLKIVDAYVNPDGREGDGSAKVKTYPTTLRLSDVDVAERRVMRLALLAGRVAQLASRDDDMPRVEGAVRSALAQLGTLDTDLWHAWVKSEKAHLSGPEAAILDVEGFAWTASRKGYVTEIRYREDAQAYTRQGKHYVQGMDASAYLSERDM